jgi:hypothetical protein
MRNLRYVCVAIIAMIGVCGMVSAGVFSCWASRVREPEIAPEALFQYQLASLPPDWSSEEWTLWTDSDRTWARWTAVTYFGTEDAPGAITEELHVFSSPGRAMVIAPSVMSVTVDWPRQRPPGWDYRPPHADRFLIGFEAHNGQQGKCMVLLRYSEYTIVASFLFSENYNSDDLRVFLEKTDAFMVEFLQKSYLSRGERPIPN